jgi:Ala-tRNA(Pro) deacylase
VNDVARIVFEKLDKMGIAAPFVEHQPAHTMEDCRAAEIALSAVMPKNIFLTPRNRSAFYLLIVRPDARFKTADVSKQLGVSRLSFAPEEDLRRMLNTYPGAITPMGLLFDEDRAVRVVIDSALRDAQVLAFHPCDNEASLALTNDDFFGRFLPKLNCAPAYVEIHDFIEN